MGSIAATILMVATADQDPELLETWPMCVYSWNTGSTVHLVILVATAILFLLGLCLFVYCNSSLVIILWRYQQQKAKSVLAELSNAVKALNNTEKDNKTTKRARTKSENDDGRGGGLKINITNTPPPADDNVVTTPKIVLHAAQDGDDEGANKIIPGEHPLARASIVILNEQKCVPYGCETKLYKKQKSNDSARSTKSILKRARSDENVEKVNGTPKIVECDEKVTNSSQVQLVEQTATPAEKQTNTSEETEDTKVTKVTKDTTDDNSSDTTSQVSD